MKSVGASIVFISTVLQNVVCFSESVKGNLGYCFSEKFFYLINCT